MAMVVTPADANGRKAEGWEHLDVRTPGEFSNVRAPNSVNIPVMLRGEDGMQANPTFISDVEQRFPKDSRIIVSCASGVRSARAASELISAGYVSVLDVEGGMNAWSADASLPTESS